MCLAVDMFTCNNMFVTQSVEQEFPSVPFTATETRTLDNSFEKKSEDVCKIFFSSLQNGLFMFDMQTV